MLQVAHELHVVERAAAVPLARVVLQTATVEGDWRRVLHGEYLELQLLARAGRLSVCACARKRATKTQTKTPNSLQVRNGND